MDEASKEPAAFRWWPLVAGALSGIALRLIYSGNPGGAFAPMAGAFVYLAPVVVSAVTVYIAEKKRRQTWAYYFWAPASANVLFVLGTMLILIEGLICAVIIMPFFAILGGVVGLIMGAFCRYTNWPKHAVYGVGVLPLLLGAFADQGTAPRYLGSIERSIVIEAPPDRIWRNLMEARDIKPEEVDRALLYRIGVPLPVSGVTRQTPDGLIRAVRMGKSVHFEQYSDDWLENRRVRWQYRFAKDSFPPGALDDHVVIGGHYFDLLDTTYSLSPLDGRGTELKITMTYRVSTDFNWYADPVARLLIGNFEKVILEFYRDRSISGQTPH
jgi:hypothetical protein